MLIDSRDSACVFRHYRFILCISNELPGPIWVSSSSLEQLGGSGQMCHLVSMGHSRSLRVWVLDPLLISLSFVFITSFHVKFSASSLHLFIVWWILVNQVRSRWLWRLITKTVSYHDVREIEGTNRRDCGLLVKTMLSEIFGIDVNIIICFINGQTFRARDFILRQSSNSFVDTELLKNLSNELIITDFLNVFD